MSANIDVYFSFRSPYSYLVTPQLLRLRDDFDVTVSLRPVLPLAIREPEFFSPDNIKRARYIMIDFPRRCEMLGMACHWPSPDPIEANKRGRGIDFAYEVSHLLFGGTKDWDKGDHMARACARAGLDLSEMEAALKAEDLGDELGKNQAALEAAHHWGVPTCVYKGAPFFGEDRIDTLRWALTKDGLAKEGA